MHAMVCVCMHVMVGMHACTCATVGVCLHAMVGLHCVCMLWCVCMHAVVGVCVYACYGRCGCVMHAMVGMCMHTCVCVYVCMHTCIVTALNLPFLLSRQMLQPPDYCWFCQCPYTKELMKPQSPGEDNSFQM